MTSYSRARRLITKCALVGVVAAVSGCTLARINARGAVPVMLNNPTQKVDVIKHVEARKSIYFDYTSAFDASEILAQTLADTKADAIINVGLTVKTTPGNFFANLFTLGLANAKTLVVAADAVRMPGGMSMLLEVPGNEVLASAEQLDALVPALAAAADDGRTTLVLGQVAGDDGRCTYQLLRCKLEE